MNKLILILCIVCFVSCRRETITIVPFKMMNRVDTFYYKGKPSINRLDYFLVKKYKDNKRYDEYIDGFVLKKRPADFAKYNQYTIVVYKESDKTNLRGNAYDSNIIDKYSSQEDMILDYNWFSGKGFIKHKIRDGLTLIDTTNNKVKIIDIK